MSTRFLTILFLQFFAMSMSAQRTLLDDDWEFRLDGESWQRTDIPHDWSIEGQFSKEAPAGNDGGYLPTGLGWYRKELSPINAQHARLLFDGVYMNAEVRLNGTLLGGHPYGFVPFSTIDLVPYLSRTDKNIIEVRVDNSQQKNCRWYTGSGIYRHVWLEEYDDIHLTTDGIGITTDSISDGHATIHARIEVCNESHKTEEVCVRMNIGEQQCSTSIPIKAGEKELFPLTLTLLHPRLWSPDTPNLYQARIEVLAKDKVTDSYTESFGVRSFSYSAEDGFRLNGQPILINGACLHHDNGPLGAAAFDAAEVHRVRLMKEAGFNLLRTSHNPPSKAFLDACDSIGMMVIDEAFDGWRDEKNRHDYHELFADWAITDIQTMIRRDRNHPGIIAWSIGNEIIERKKPQAVKDAHMLAKAVHDIDPTRPVTQALAAWDPDWEIYDPLAAEHDIVGYNYMIHKHETDHQRVPSRIIWQTESYPRDAFQNWNITHDNNYVIGDIVWTGLDYIGESGIGRYYYEGQTPGEHYQHDQWPYHGAYCGDVDITGLRKPVSYYRDMLWNNNPQLYMAVREPDGYYGKIKETLWSVWPTWESWNWEGWEGKGIDVEVSSRYPKVRLYLNEKLIGEQQVSRDTKFQAIFHIPYQTGTLKAEGIDEQGSVRESKILHTAGKPVGIRIIPDRTTLKADNQDLSFITIEVIDKDGNTCPNADNLLQVGIKGDATLAAFCNADWRDLGSVRDNEHKAWKGRAQAIVRSGKKHGKATITVSSPTLRCRSIKIQTR